MGTIIQLQKLTGAIARVHEAIAFFMSRWAITKLR